MAIEPEDVAWFVRWAGVLKKVRDGAASTEPVSFTPMECRDLSRGIEGLSGLTKDAYDGLG